MDFLWRGGESGVRDASLPPRVWYTRVASEAITRPLVTLAKALVRPFQSRKPKQRADTSSSADASLAMARRKVRKLRQQAARHVLGSRAEARLVARALVDELVDEALTVVLPPSIERHSADGHSKHRRLPGLLPTISSSQSLSSGSMGSGRGSGRWTRRSKEASARGSTSYLASAVEESIGSEREALDLLLDGGTAEKATSDAGAGHSPLQKLVLFYRKAARLDLARMYPRPLCQWLRRYSLQPAL